MARNGEPKGTRHRLDFEERFKLAFDVLAAITRGDRKMADLQDMYASPPPGESGEEGPRGPVLDVGTIQDVFKALRAVGVGISFNAARDRNCYEVTSAGMPLLASREEAAALELALAYLQSLKLPEAETLARFCERVVAPPHGEARRDARVRIRKAVDDERSIKKWLKSVQGAIAKGQPFLILYQAGVAEPVWWLIDRCEITDEFQTLSLWAHACKLGPTAAIPVTPGWKSVEFRIDRILRMEATYPGLPLRCENPDPPPYKNYWYWVHPELAARLPDRDHRFQEVMRDRKDAAGWVLVKDRFNQKFRATRHLLAYGDMARAEAPVDFVADLRAKAQAMAEAYHAAIASGS